MNTIQQIAYAKKFTDTYFSFSEDQKALREAACLKLQFSECFLPPEKDELLMGKYDHPCIGFGMQEAGMGFFLNEEIYQQLYKNHPEMKAELDVLREKWLPETGRQQLICKTPAHILREIPNDHFANESNIGFWLCRMSSTHLDFDKLLQLGIPGLRRQVMEYLSASFDEEKQTFYRGPLACLDAICEVADACAAKAECSNAIHGKEIARNLRNITHDRPKTFWEAVQLMYLYALMSGTYNYGRMDEYLGDFLERDLQDHVLTREQAKDILTPLWKLMIHRQTTWDARVFVGGKGRRNERAANEVALLAIEVTGVVKDVLPQFSLRFYSGQDPRLLDLAYQVIGSLCDYPILYNDDLNIPSVQKAFHVSRKRRNSIFHLGAGSIFFITAQLERRVILLTY